MGFPVAATCQPANPPFCSCSPTTTSSITTPPHPQRCTHCRSCRLCFECIILIELYLHFALYFLLQFAPRSMASGQIQIISFQQRRIHATSTSGTGKNTNVPSSPGPSPACGKKNVSSVFFRGKTKILAHEHWQLQKATDPLSERYTFKRKTGEINLD